MKVFQATLRVATLDQQGKEQVQEVLYNMFRTALDYDDILPFYYVADFHGLEQIPCQPCDVTDPPRDWEDGEEDGYNAAWEAWLNPTAHAVKG